MTRFDVMTDLLNRRKFFKLVCGAGNEDAAEVEKLAFVYTLAGAKGMDVSANTDVVKSALKGIDEALAYAPKIKKNITIRPFINVSIGMRGDPHVRKAEITEKCVRCGSCIEQCKTRAITKELKIIEAKCIGCGDCDAVCRVGAVKFYHKNKDLRSILTECKKLGVEQLELHAAVPDSDSIFEEWSMIDQIMSDGYVSMCLDRLHLSDSHLRDRIKKARSISNDRLIIQADGVPMSGGKDDFNTTLQAIAIADMIMKSALGVKVLLSGGTNSLTAKLADMCGIAYNGVTIGTFARSIIKEWLKKDDFMNCHEDIEKAVERAEKLVRENIGDIVW
ncbi:MAG: LdpA C-terminal domain-containing domain [Candidatus Omnitrophota bacterium]|jgi:Fe-S-cluster-containing hydrogenase component 2